MFVDEDEARLESIQSISERSASMPQKALKTELNSIKFDLGIQSKTRVDGQNRAYQLKDVRIGGVYCQVLEPNSGCDPQKKTKKSRFRQAYLGSESSTTSEAYEIDRSESSWSSSEDGVSEEDIHYDRDRLVRKPNGGIDEERCMKFVLKSNTAINEIVDFLEDFILRDVIDTSKYRGFDIYQKTILDLTISHILNRKVDFSAEDNPLIIDDDFKPKRNDEKSKIIMSIIQKTIINKYKRKLKIKQELRKKNLYLAIYYHFAYKRERENYKLVSNTPDMKKRYKQAEFSFKPKNSITKLYVQNLCPSIFSKIIEIGSNFEYLEKLYRRQVSNILFGLFKKFDKRNMVDKKPDYMSESSTINTIPETCYYTILNRLTSKTKNSALKCKLPVSIRFIRNYAEYALKKLKTYRNFPIGIRSSNAL